MSKQEGEFIRLVTEHGDTYDDEVYVRGHVDEPAFREAVAAWHDDPDDPPDYGPIRHAWARWEFSGQDAWGEAWRVLVEHREQKRGCFRVTAATAGYILRRRERAAAQEAADVAYILSHYPGVEVVHRNGYGRDYRLRVPGCASDVRVGWRDWRAYHERRRGPELVTFAAWCVGSDLPAWSAFVDGLDAQEAAAAGSTP